MGKTRLALEVGAQAQANFEDGVWLAELTALTDPGFVPQAVGEILGVGEVCADVILPGLISFLRDKSLL